MKYIISGFIFLGIFLLANCQNNRSSSSTANEIYLEKGKQITATSFAALSSQLQKAMKEGGVSNAVKYCNVVASPLIDSLSQIHQAKIRRTSLKIRNPKNKPTAAENLQLQIYQQEVNNGKSLKPVVKEIDAQTIAFYAPIHILPVCEKCHGHIGKTLAEEDYKIIQAFYPEDKAIGYSTGHLRGMWSISFKK